MAQKPAPIGPLRAHSGVCRTHTTTHHSR